MSRTRKGNFILINYQQTFFFIIPFFFWTLQLASCLIEFPKDKKKRQSKPGGSDSKESAYSVGDPALIPRSGRSPGEGNVYPLQYSFLENSTEEPGGLQSMGSQRVGHD